MVSIDCAALCCSTGHALTGITIATMTSLRHRPTTDEPRWRYAQFLRQGGYVTVVVVCLSVSKFAQKLGMDLHEIFREG